MSNIRGLTLFIADIRNCKTEEQEQKRVDKELAKIRKQFRKKNIDSYTRKKYLWKIIYMYVLGFDVEFGHMEAINMITVNKYTEKQVGYMALSVLLVEHEDLLRLCIQSIKNDLNSSNEVFQCMALTAIANIAEHEMAETLAADVKRILVHPTSLNFVRKKAALCLLRLCIKFPDIIETESFAPKCVQLLNYGNIGVLTSVMSLLLQLVENDSSGYEDCLKHCVHLLAKLSVTQDCPKEYLYYQTPCPWLQIKLLKFIQCFPPPSNLDSSEGFSPQLRESLERILTKTKITKNVNKNNADHSILFEAVNVIIYLNLDGSHPLYKRAVSLLSQFISVREANVRYLGLEAMAKLAKVPGTIDAIKKHQKSIERSIEDNDISIRKRALDLLYEMCDKNNAANIVENLLKCLKSATYGMKEEMVLKIALLSERFASDLKWYFDVCMELLQSAGDFVTEDIWFRIVQIVTNNEDLQSYAVGVVYEVLINDNVHENAVKVGGYLLGEFGHSMEDKSGQSQFEVLNKHFSRVSSATKALLLSTYMKLANVHEDLLSVVKECFQSNLISGDPEIQQRASEYLRMACYHDREFVNDIWEAMPDFPDKVEKKRARLSRISSISSICAEREDEGDNEEGQGEESDWTEDEEELEKEREEEESREKSEEEGFGFQSYGDVYMASKLKRSPEGHEDEERENRQSSEEDDEEQHSSESDDEIMTYKKRSEVDLLGLNLEELGMVSNPNPNPLNPIPPIDIHPFISVDQPLVPSFQAPLKDSVADKLQLEVQNEKNFLSLCSKGSNGVLFESNLIQIGVKTKVEGPICKMILYYGNYDSRESLMNISVNLELEDLQVQMKPSEPFNVGPKKQETQYFMFTCLKEFVSPPLLQVKYIHAGKSVCLRLKLPILISKFFSPWHCTMQEFVSKWKSFEKTEEKFMFKARSAIDLPKIRNFFEEQNMAVHPSPTKSPTTIVTSCLLNMAKIQQHILIRLETSQSTKMFGATVRTSQLSVSNAAKSFLIAMMGIDSEE